MDRMTSALTPVDRSQFIPAMSIELAVERYNTITEFVTACSGATLTMG